MADYRELVKALRCKGLSKECDSCDYGYRLCPDSECNDACHVAQIYADAAAAIEALQADIRRKEGAGMSECVVRIEMPSDCERCPMCGTASGGNGMYELWCMCGDIPASSQRRPEDCPIVCQLPEGHGRLVDADKEIDFHVNDLERLTAEDIDVYSKAYSLSDLCDGITYAYDHANIIVPADTAERSETEQV